MNHETQFTDIVARSQKFFAEANPAKVSDLQVLENFEKRESFTVCVAGGFSRGKSHFINLLLGENILPESAVPTTGCLTEIVYGADPFMEIISNGKVEKLALDSALLDQYSLHTGKDVSNTAIRIHYPASLLKNGIILVDTPGVEDINHDNAGLVFSALQNADAAIVMVSAISPFSLTEQAFISEYLIDRHVPLIAAGISFYDQVSSGDERMQLEYIAEKCLDLYPQMSLFMAGEHLADAPDNIICGVEKIRSEITKWAKLPSLQQIKQRVALSRILDLVKAELECQQDAKNALDGDVEAKKKELLAQLAELDDGSGEVMKLKEKFLGRAELLKDRIRRQVKVLGEECLNTYDSTKDLQCMAEKVQEMYAEIIQESQRALRKDMKDLLQELESIYGRQKEFVLPEANFSEMPVTKLGKEQSDEDSIVDYILGMARDFIREYGQVIPVLLDRYGTRMPYGKVVWPVLKPYVDRIFEMVGNFADGNSRAVLEKDISNVCSRMSRNLANDIQDIYTHAFNQIRDLKKAWLARQEEILREAGGMNELDQMRNKIGERIETARQLCQDIENAEGKRYELL